MIQQQHNKPVVAEFDFYGTLTGYNKLFPFLWHVAGPVKLTYWGMLMLPTLAAYGLGLIRNDIAKVKVMRCFPADMDMTTLQHRGLLNEITIVAA